MNLDTNVKNAMSMMTDFNTSHNTLLIAMALISATAVLGAAGTYSLSGVATAATANDDSNVTLTVAEETSVQITPDLFNFSDMTLGETNFSDISDLTYTIKNDGSTNITNVYAHPNTLESEQDNPLGTGSANQYAAGRFLWIKNDTSDFYHAGSLTWNITEDAGGKPSGITEGDDNPQAWGYYRNASGDYLWSLGGNGTSTDKSWCNTTDNNAPEFYIKDNADTGENRDLSDTGTTTSYTLSTTNNNWAGTYANQGGALDGHYISAYRNCNKVYIYRFDEDGTLPDFTSNEERQRLFNGTIEPSSTRQGRVGAAVPEGIPAGTTNRTVLTIHVSSQ